MAEEIDVLESWEELDDNEVLNKKLKDIKVKDPSEQRPTGPVNVPLEEGSRTQFTPQVRILKRDADSSQGQNLPRAQAQPQKSLQQREAEYNEARLRILGEGYTGVENTNANTNNSAAVQDNSRPFKLIQHTENANTDKVQILREPKGPDGSPGFNQGR